MWMKTIESSILKFKKEKLLSLKKKKWDKQSTNTSGKYGRQASDTEQHLI